jgi:Pentapeptide repeats (8 copies)
VDTERQAGTGGSVPPLTRADVERLRSKVESAAQLDLSLQNLQHVDLSYLDLQGANLRGADLQGAQLRGTNLSEADLRGANLSDADLDGADLSCAHLGENEANRAKLHRTKLSYATLRGLDLRGFDLTDLNLRYADLNGTDLRDAVLRGADLQGADLSTAHLHGPELRGARLYRDELFSNRMRHTRRGMTTQQRLTPAEPLLIQTSSSPLQGQAVKQSKTALSDREAYLLGEHALLAGADPVKIRQLFPQGFSFAMARRLFDAWLVHSGDTYSGQEVNAMWVGFAHYICDLYHRDESEM